MVILVLILFVFFILILLAFVVVFITMLSQELWYGQKNNAPFVPAPDSIMQDLVNTIPVTKDSIVFDLGSGDGKVLRALYDHVGVGTYVGIERGFVPYVLATIKQRTINNISFKRQDFFGTNVSRATIVILYLFPELMNTLLPKLKRELKPGTVVYSIDFKFTDLVPNEVFEFDQTRKRGRKLFKYIF